MKNKQATYEGSVKTAQDKDDFKVPAADKHIGSCAICFEAPQTHIFVPCGHICSCKSCSAKIMAKNKKCPICNKHSMMANEVFFA